MGSAQVATIIAAILGVAGVAIGVDAIVKYEKAKKVENSASS
ncbi:hypothetical protein [Candidatus Mycoplasma haematohominis]|uniref:Uncharacterized protein n=1 Tax=Candidatus Mycoplasma haematohominis TaxID=1494318 RepID=A0A478FRA5_9MOLU|nr:hypothetical protein MHSWG343_10510 [Candidatus Mycoplasma haemohominis]